MQQLCFFLLQSFKHPHCKSQTHAPCEVTSARTYSLPIEENCVALKETNVLAYPKSAHSIQYIVGSRKSAIHNKSLHFAAPFIKNWTDTFLADCFLFHPPNLKTCPGHKKVTASCNSAWQVKTNYLSAQMFAICTTGKVMLTKQAGNAVQMILPQVHLQKPCYDFSFL